MSTLPKSAPYYRKFLNGDFGHSHAAQEFVVWAVCVGLSGWFIAAPVAILFALYFELCADQHWIKRETDQSLAMNRKPIDGLDMVEVPSEPNGFWTQDAINDVLFPRKLRKVWFVLSVIYVAWLVYAVGTKGVILQ